MNRKGFISIIALLIMTVVLLSSIYLLYMSILQSNINRNINLSNQGYYYSEAKILKAIYDEKYYKNQLENIILREFRGILPIPLTMVLDETEKISSDDSKVINVNFEIKDNRKYLKLTANTNYNNIKNKMYINFSLVKDLFELGIPILSSDYLNNEDYEDLTQFTLNLKQNLKTNNLPSHMNGISTFDYEKLSIYSNKGGHRIITYYRNGEEIKSETYPKREFVFNIQNHIHKDISLTVDSPEYPTRLSGILYLEGNLIINSELLFEGIIIINNGQIIVNSEVDPKIQGMIIMIGEKSYLNKEDLNLIYDQKQIYRYGTYLPGFLDYKIDVMKKVK